jgi:hypothetical protein
MTCAVLRIATTFQTRGSHWAVTIVFAALATFQPLSNIHQSVSNNFGLQLARQAKPASAAGLTERSRRFPRATSFVGIAESREQFAGKLLPWPWRVRKALRTPPKRLRYRPHKRRSHTDGYKDPVFGSVLGLAKSIGKEPAGRLEEPGKRISREKRSDCRSDSTGFRSGK